MTDDINCLVGYHKTKMEELILNHTYLIRYGSNTDMLNSVTVLLITAKAYHLRYNNGQDTSLSWMQKDYFDRSYTVVEDISDFMTDKSEEKPLTYTITYNGNEIKWHPCFYTTETCPTCGGSRQVRDFNTTSSYKICPQCNGSGIASKKTDIVFE